MTTNEYQYAYDGHGRLVVERFLIDGVLQSHETTYWDGTNRLAEFNPSGEITRYYTSGPGPNEVLAVDQNGQTAWALHDQIGSVVAWAEYDSSEWEVQYFEFDSFGNLQSATGSLTLGALPTIWAGHQLDEGTGYYHAQWRWYDPETGQFLSQDPILDDNNAYRYTGNDPANKVDPTGLAEFSALEFNGQAIEFRMHAQGTRKLDSALANKTARELFPGFRKGGALKGVWHHADFDQKTGEFIMQLVDKAKHEATSHTGGFAKYLDWVTEVVSTGDIAKLSEKQATSIKQSLSAVTQATDDGKQLLSRLSKQGITVGKTVSGGIKVLRKGNELFEILRHSPKGQWAKAIFKVAGKSLPFIFVFGAAAQAKARGGSNFDAGKAAMRELVSADLVEDAFRITVIRGSETIYNHLVKGPSLKSRQILMNLSKPEREAYARKHGWDLSMYEEFRD